MFRHIVAATLAASAALFGASIAEAANSTLWIHGRNSGQLGQPAQYGDFAYWGSSDAAAGVNKQAVNWEGTNSISSTNGRIRDALDCYCTGTNWCYVAAHSAGDVQIGYALSMYGASTRSVRNGVPGAGGACGATGGTQTGWNIKWVDVAGGAGGGSDLADLGYWLVGEGITNDLRTSTARSLYDHNQTRGKWFYMFAGARGTIYSGVIQGQDDEVVSYASAGGVSKTGSFCNPGDLLCDATLPTGTGAASWSCGFLWLSTCTAQKWSYHTVDKRDDSESFDHYSAGSWTGIVGPVRTDAVTYAY